MHPHGHVQLVGSRYLFSGCTTHWLSQVCDGQAVHFHIASLFILLEGTGKCVLQVCVIFILGVGHCCLFLQSNLSGGQTYQCFPHHLSHVPGIFLTPRLNWKRPTHSLVLSEDVPIPETTSLTSHSKEGSLIILPPILPLENTSGSCQFAFLFSSNYFLISPQASLTH